MGPTCPLLHGPNLGHVHQHYDFQILRIIFGLPLIYTRCPPIAFSSGEEGEKIMPVVLDSLSLYNQRGNTNTKPRYRDLLLKPPFEPSQAAPNHPQNGFLGLSTPYQLPSLFGGLEPGGLVSGFPFSLCKSQGPAIRIQTSNPNQLS